MKPNIRLVDKSQIDYSRMMEALNAKAEDDYRRESMALIATLLCLCAFATALAFWPELTAWVW